MCRLLGFVSRQPTTLSELLGEDELAEFTELSVKHGDGWGFARAAGHGIEVTKAPDSARESALFRGVSHEQEADLGLLHLRWATQGLGVTLDNTHPFTNGHVAFAHNGSVKPPDSLDRLVPAEIAGLRKGTTDSERYFLATLAAAREGDASTALARTASRIAEECVFGSVNAMIATPHELQVINIFDPAAEAKESEPNYYRIGYKVDTEADTVIVASSGWGSGWTFIENGELLTIDRATREVAVRRVMDAPVSR